MMKIEEIPIVLIKPYWRNPRKNAAAVNSVAASIRDYGFNVPIGIDKDNTIITGHTRYLAAKQLNLQAIPCIVLDHLSNDKVKEYRIADNASADLSEWDNTLLIAEMREFTQIPAFLESYFPTDNALKASFESIKTAAQLFKPTTPDHIQQSERDLNTSFGSRVDEAYDDQVEVMCPHCAVPFYVSMSGMEAEQEDVKHRKALAAIRNAGNSGKSGKVGEP